MKEYNKQRAAAQRRRAADYRAMYPDRVIETRAKYRAEHLARRAAYRAANPDRVRATKAKYRIRHTDKINAYSNARRARKLGQCSVMSNIERTVLKAFYATARRFREVTGEPYHVDHIMPLAKGGAHHPSNLQVLKAIENLKKGIS